MCHHVAGWSTKSVLMNVGVCALLLPELRAFHIGPTALSAPDLRNGNPGSDHEPMAADRGDMSCDIVRPGRSSFRPARS